jgi:hypothetical protein
MNVEWPAGDVVRGADAREDAIDERDLGLARRHERAGLRHDAEQRGLAQVGGLAAHVGPGQDHELRRCRVERDVVRHERVAAGPALDDRMPRIDDDHLVAVVDVRLDVVVDRRRFGERAEHVERRQRAGGRLDARRLGRDLASQALEDLQLALEDPLVGAEHLLLVLLERRRDVALAAGIVCLRW